MGLSIIISVALAATMIVVVLVLVAAVVYQRWQIGDKNAALGHFIRENARMRQKLLRAGLLSFALFILCCCGDDEADRYINNEATIGSASPVSDESYTPRMNNMIHYLSLKH